MVENLVSTYKCPFCGAKEISEKNIDIVWAAGNTVNIDMHCPSCNKHFMAKTEVVQMEIGNLWAEKLSQLQESLMALKGKLGWNIEIETQGLENVQKDSIKDENILGLREQMKKQDLNASDLFDDTSEND